MNYEAALTIDGVKHSGEAPSLLSPPADCAEAVRPTAAVVMAAEEEPRR